ncbi:hypothetical protein [Lysobacter gummosus]
MSQHGFWRRPRREIFRDHWPRAFQCAVQGPFDLLDVDEQPK